MTNMHIIRTRIINSITDVDIERVAAPNCRENWMCQALGAKGVGLFFLQEALPRLQIFWQLEKTLIGQPGISFLVSVLLHCQPL